VRGLGTGIFCFTTTLASLANAQNRSDPYELVDQFARVLNRIEQEYVEPAPTEKMVQGAIEGIVGALDPHSAYMPPDDYDDFKADASGQFAGIGVEVDLRHGQVTVIAPIGGSPAELAGIRSGDRIVSVNGIVPDTLPLTEIVHRMRGKKGSTVHLTVRRAGRASSLEFNIVRGDVHMPSIYVRRFDHDIVYVRIAAFQEGTHGELLEKLGNLRAETNFKGLLLDLRQNPGGLVSESVAVADEFLGAGLLFFTRQREMVIDRIDTTNSGYFENVPMVALVDEGTASAAEILAGALKDRQRCSVVGTRTFGKGTVQTIMDLPGGAGLRLTAMRYYTPAGNGIQASGVLPDEIVSDAAPEQSKVSRESDLPNHLPSEQAVSLSEATRTNLDELPSAQPCENPKPLVTLSERIRRWPASPTDEDGKILARGFQLLLSRL
jgi:carboxyl-terminal processing protease